MYNGRVVRLRPFEWEDAERYRDWVNDASLASLVDRVRPVTLAEHRLWYENITRSGSVLMFAVDERRSGRFLGCVWLFGIDWRHRRAEMRILLGARNLKTKGRGTDAIRTLAGIAFERLNLGKIFAEVLESNARACRAFESAGFRKEGLLKKDRFVDGDYANVVRFGFLRDEFTP